MLGRRTGSAHACRPGPPASSACTANAIRGADVHLASKSNAVTNWVNVFSRLIEKAARLTARRASIASSGPRALTALRTLSQQLSWSRFTELLPLEQSLQRGSLRWPDKHERESDEVSLLGIIICTGKKSEQIELLELDRSGIHVAEYLSALPPRKVLGEKLQLAAERARRQLEQRAPTDGAGPATVKRGLKTSRRKGRQGASRWTDRGRGRASPFGRDASDPPRGWRDTHFPGHNPGSNPSRALPAVGSGKSGCLGFRARKGNG